MCALIPEAQLSPGLHPQQRGQQAREGILPLCSALVRPPPGVLCPALEPSAQDSLGAGPEEATAMIRQLEHLCCGERLRQLGLFSLQKKRPRGDLIAAFQYLKGACKKDRDRLFSKACCDRTRGNGFKLKEGKFRLGITKKFFTMRVVRHWHRLRREVVAAPSLETFNTRLNGGSEQPDLVKDAPAHCRGVGLCDL